MNKYYFTFGSIHVAPEGTENPGLPLLKYYVTIEAENMNIARGIMFARYNDKWSFSYGVEQFDQAIKKWGLKEYERIIQDQPSKAV